MKKIPLGPVIVELIGPSGSGKSAFAQSFAVHDKYEVVSSDALRERFAGDRRRQDRNDLVYNEFDRQICMRLEQGKRVVADATHIRDTSRRRTAKLARKYGAKVVYVVFDRSITAKYHKAGWRADVRIGGKSLIDRDQEGFDANIGKILSGDAGLADVVIDTRTEEFDVVMPLSRSDPTLTPEQAVLADITSRGYQGILYVGDIHGNLIGLQKMIDLARRLNLFLFTMGDLVDYAPGTIAVADLFAELMFQGEAGGILGNHERKMLRYVTKERIEGIYANEGGFQGELSHGNDVTVNQIKAKTDRERWRWETRFIGMCELLPHFVRMPRYYFVHGAATPKMLQADEFWFNRNTKEETYAMYGQVSGHDKDNPLRCYDWLDEIPPGMTVVIGHDCLCQTEPFVKRGALGGRLVALDTGSSKPDRAPNGRLSAMALDIDYHKKDGWKLVNEQFYSDVDL